MAKPEKQFRIGSVASSVFGNEITGEDGSKRTVRSVTLQRGYRDDKGEWRNATSFGLSDLPAAIRVLELALRYVESQEAET